MSDIGCGKRITSVERSDSSADARYYSTVPYGLSLQFLFQHNDGFLPGRRVARLAVANGKCHDLACPSAHRCPQPPCASFFQHKTPHLIEFKHVIWGCRQERICYLGQFLDMRADPASNRLSSDVKDALNSTQTATLQASPEHSSFVDFRIGWLWREHPIGATILAMVLSCSTAVRSIFDTRCTSTDTTFKRFRFLNHVLYHISSLTT